MRLSNGSIGMLLLLVASLGAAEQHFAPPTPTAPALNLEGLEQLAMHCNPTLAEAMHAVESSRGKALQAGLPPNPTVGYVGEQIGIEGTAGEMQGLFVQQSIVTAGKLRLSREKYSQEARQAEIQVMAQQLRVLNGVRSRYYETLAALRVVEIHRELLDNAAQSLLTHREMFNTGQADETDVLMREVAQERARIALKSAENRALAARVHLASVVGAPHVADQPLIDCLEPDGAPLEWESSLQVLLRDSPELMFALAHVRHDQIMVEREKVEPVPNINVQTAAGYSYETSDAVAGVQIGLDVPIWNRNQGSIRQARADLARSQAEVARIELALCSRLAAAFNRYNTAWAAVQAYRKINLPKTQQAFDLINEMYEERRRPWMDVVEMKRTLLDVRSEYTQQLLALRKAEVEICGLLLVDGLEQPPSPVPGGHLDATPQPR